MRAEDWPMLGVTAEPGKAPARRAGELEGHLRHARAAAPGEARFRLAAAVAEENAAVTSRRPPLPGKAGDPRLERLASQYAELASVPAIAAEARLRHGVTMMRLGRTEAALADFAAAGAKTTDAHVRHVGAFLSAVVHERGGRSAEALR